MNNNPKTENLKPWKKGIDSPNPNGRPKKFITTFKGNGLSMSEVHDIISAMLTMRETELQKIEKSQDATILECIIARALLSSSKKGSLHAIESLLNRTLGTPKIQQDLNITQNTMNVTLDLSH